MIEKYYKYKLDYRDYILFIKVGNFYECINKDALIINNIFKYKIKIVSNNIRVGFPTNSISSVTNKLQEDNLNYIIIDNNNIKDIYKVDNNNYNKYNYDIDNIIYNYLKINKIIKYLEDNITNNIEDILDKIDKILFK